jgi:hypothetical protein
VKSPKVIGLLLALNLAVFLGIFYYFLKARVAEPIALSAGVASKPEWTEPRVIEQIVAITNRLQWSQLESEDYKTYIARLRSIGCPEQTIRDLIIADLDTLLAPEVRDIHKLRKDLKYWHPVEEELTNDVNPSEVEKKQRAIDQRKRDIIRELVNVDLTRERMKLQGQEDYYERRLNFLPAERRTQVRDVLEKFDEAEKTLREKAEEEGEAMNISDRAQLRALADQREAEVTNLLSPQEREQYELWLSPTANGVRYSLYGMNGTEQEFLAIYKARKAFDEKWAKRDVELLDEPSRQQMEQDRGQAEQNIQRALGDERYAEYQRGESPEFHELSALVTRSRLPKEKAAEVYGYKLVADSYRQQVRNDANLNPQQKQEALQSIARETQKVVESALGTKALRRYLNSGGGKWMKE